MRIRSIASVALLVLTPVAVHAATTKEFHKVVPLQAGGRVSVDSHNGSVAVSAWDRPEVQIDAVIEPATDNTAEDVANTAIKVTASPSSVDILSDYSAVETHGTFWGNSRTLPPVRYTIHVPASAAVTAHVHNASVKVNGVKNDLVLSTHNGTVDVDGLVGAARVETHNGDVRLNFAGTPKTSSIETHNGDAVVTVPAEAKLSVTVDTHRSNAFSSDIPASIRLSNDVSTAALNGGGPELKFESHNGTLHIAKR